MPSSGLETHRGDQFLPDSDEHFGDLINPEIEVRVIARTQQIMAESRAKGEPVILLVAAQMAVQEVLNDIPGEFDKFDEYKDAVIAALSTERRGGQKSGSLRR